MKKVMAVLMVVVMVVSLVGCGDKISADVKNTMNEYESLCDEYCEIAKKAANGDTAEAAADAVQIMSKLSDVQKKVDELSKKDLSQEEKDYILEVAERGQKKVQDAMSSLEQ